VSVIPNPPRSTRKAPGDAAGPRRGLGYQPCLYFVDEDGKAKPWSYDVEYQAASDEAAVEESGDDLDQGW
jgi:hypothetical protein